MHERVRRAVMSAGAADSVAAVSQSACAALGGQDLALVRVWILGSDGELRLTASAGAPVGGGSYSRIDGEFSRIHRGVGKIGQVAATATPLLVRDLRGDEDWLANPGWIARQGIRALVALPLIAAGTVGGVLALFSREPLTDDVIGDMRFLADFVAVRIHTLAAPAPAAIAPSPILHTRGQLREIEKASISAALARTQGRIFGPGGAARLLEMKPTTLISRIKALDIPAGNRPE